METIENKVVPITGANRGIGKAIVKRFLQAGTAKIYAAARDLDSLAPLVAAHGQGIVPIQIDLNRPETITQAAKQAKDVDMVVNNAGILKIASPLSEDAIAALRGEMEVNVYGLMRMAQAFAPVLKANGGGVLVQLNSVASFNNFPDFATYSASKAAAYSITQGLREKLRAQGTFVMSVHPGPIDTEMADSAGLGDISEPAALVPEAILSALKQGEFHVYPDSMAKQVGATYKDFATNVIEANLRG